MVGVVDNHIPPPTANEGANMAVGERIVVDAVATHLQREKP